MYSMIEIATNGDGKVTLDTEKLNEYISEKVEQQTQTLKAELEQQSKTIQTLNQKVETLKSQNLDKKFIDTNNLIYETGDWGTWDNTSYSYTATQDCAVICWMNCKEIGRFVLKLNGVQFGIFTNSNSMNVTENNIIYLKTGDTLELEHTGGSTGAKILVFKLK